MIKTGPRGAFVKWTLFTRPQIEEWGKISKQKKMACKQTQNRLADRVLNRL